MPKLKPNTSDKAVGKGRSDRVRASTASSRARASGQEDAKSRASARNKAGGKGERNGKSSARLARPKTDRIPKPEPARANKPGSDRIAKAEPVRKAKPDTGRLAKVEPVRASAKPDIGRLAKTESARANASKPDPVRVAKPDTGRMAKVEVARSNPDTGRVAAAKPDRVAKSDRIATAGKPEREKSERISRADRSGGPDRGGRVDASQFKCPFNREDLGKYRRLLFERRAELTSGIAGLVKDAIEAEDGHTTPNHIAERGSDADLQDMSLGMVGMEEKDVWQIDRAIRKIDVGVPLAYGLCEFTKQPIPRGRLEFVPWTPLSIEGARYMDESRLMLEDMLLDD